MLLQLYIQNGLLLQFADITCLICYGDDYIQVKDFLSSDLGIATSKMQVNVEKSSVMWFSVKSSKSPHYSAINFTRRHSVNEIK